MREIREKQAANSEVPNKSRRHLPSVPKPCGIGYQTCPPRMKRFKALISGLLGHIKGRGIAPDTWQRSATSGRRNDEARTSTFLAGTPAVSFWQGFLWRHVEKPSESVSMQSQHQCIQQRSEKRGCHSPSTHGEMETDTGGPAGCSTSRVLVVSARFLPRRRKPCTDRNQAAIVACCVPAV